MAASSHASPDREPSTPTLGQFAGTWYQENLPRWRQTHADTVQGTLHQHILPKLGERSLAEITRADLLAFRAELVKQTGKGGGALSPSRINHIMTPLRMLMAEASERYEFLIPMVPLVRTALLEQRKLVSEDCRWVFAQRNGDPINLVNFTNRVWHPLLRHLGLAPRRPYQTRHTAATLMLASGENPEWVARTLGHANTEMLFRVYSRYVPNLTRNDGKAFTGLVTASSMPTSSNPRTKDAPQGTTPPLSVLTRKQLEALVAQLQQQ